VRDGRLQPESRAGATPLAEIWNGKTWKGATLPLPAGGTSGKLLAASCPTKKKCVAVGDYSGGLLAETRNGKAWTQTAPPTDKGFNHEGLEGVSCPTANSCLAVCAWLGGDTYATAAVSWNGKTSKVLPQTSGAAFTGVSCLSATHCVVVGDTVNPLIPSASMAGLAALWNGKKWSALRLP
jgi:hypothetical protein